MGVWIETAINANMASEAAVTPCMGVWIETSTNVKYMHVFGSHPVWVCGLKRADEQEKRGEKVVTPCMGVWIETRNGGGKYKGILSHTLYGCVD